MGEKKGRPSHGYQELFPREQNPWKMQLEAHIYAVPDLEISGATIWSINKRDYLKLEEAPIRFLRPLLGLTELHFSCRNNPLVDQGLLIIEAS